MYISEVTLENIRCFKYISIQFEENYSPVLLTTVLGDNSTGKTCLLRAIALGMCDEASAAALMKELPGEMIKKNTKRKKFQIDGKTRLVFKGTIKVTLKSSRRGKKHIIETNIVKEREDSPEIIYQNVEPTRFPWQKIFVCGYGSSRASTGDSSYNKYSILEAVYSLFNYGATLQNPEITYSRIERDNKNDATLLKNQLLDLLMLKDKDYSIEVNKRGMWLINPAGESVPINAMSDGHKSTTNWFLDFLGWKNLRERPNEHGILLIDEIETHIHPSWQLKLLPSIRKYFPNTQIIATTHSPMLASSTGSLLDSKRKESILHLSEKGGRIFWEHIASLKGLDYDQILAHRAFDYVMDEDPEIVGFLKKASHLATKGKDRTSNENHVYNNILNQMDDIFPPPGRTFFERELSKRRTDQIKSDIIRLEAKLFGGKK